MGYCLIHQVEIRCCILDVRRNKADAVERIARIAEGKRWRPAMMMTIDGEHEPVRPEPSLRKGKRGTGEWREAKWFRFCRLDEDRIDHSVSWRRIGPNQDIAGALKTIKDAGLIPEERIRLGGVADVRISPWPAPDLIPERTHANIGDRSNAPRAYATSFMGLTSSSIFRQA